MTKIIPKRHNTKEEIYDRIEMLKKTGRSRFMGAIYRLTENEDRAIIWQADRQIR